MCMQFRMQSTRRERDDEGWIPWDGSPGAPLKVRMRSECKCEAECVHVHVRACVRAGSCVAR